MHQVINADKHKQQNELIITRSKKTQVVSLLLKHGKHTEKLKIGFNYFSLGGKERHFFSPITKHCAAKAAKPHKMQQLKAALTLIRNGSYPL